MIPVKKIKEFIEEKSSTYQIFDIVYNKKEKDVIQKFLIENHCGFNFKGNLNELKEENKLQTFLENIGSNSEENIRIIYKIINKLIKKVLLSYSLDYFWISIRISLPHNDFKIPRWHCDGYYFKDHDALQAKFLTVLKGPGTLFIEDQNKALKIFNKIQKKELLERRKYNYNKSSNNFKKLEEIERDFKTIYVEELKMFEKSQLNNNQGLVFKRNKNKCLIHSEPNINEPRFFISILPGTNKNIEELKRK